VGPGYYETKLAPQGLKYKGPRWAKSGVKKGANFVSSTATSSLVGPGIFFHLGRRVFNMMDKQDAMIQSKWLYQITSQILILDLFRPAPDHLMLM